MIRFVVLLMLVVALHILVLGLMTDSKEDTTSVKPTPLAMTLTQLTPTQLGTHQQNNSEHANAQSSTTNQYIKDKKEEVSTHISYTKKQNNAGSKQTPSQHKQLARPINISEPTYPAEAKDAGQQGIVTIKFLVNTEGRVESPSIVKSSGFDALDMAAKNAILDWSFYPTLLNEKAISHWYQQRIIFEIEKAHTHKNIELTP
ncbi:hypothetical protein JF50_24365 [Pseudoalteromonas luteoviolacea]|uniref:Protein TonB n=1 Tax=Pseudoalteromonas luteoviolacea TaxID=43657 RepID=A0A0C1QIH8_9GAMM|nr:energy transducer TonB [Pseudoalteromonas luteoviolacea]KID54967.1 hypothetical protein JF50_24365 [Pseudoalteromonas luteoviolacea]